MKENSKKTIIRLSITVTDCVKTEVKEVEIKEDHAKSYSLVNCGRVLKSDMLKPFTKLENSVNSSNPFIGFYTYCLQEEEEKAVSILFEAAQKRISEIKKGVDKLLGAIGKSKRYCSCEKPKYNYPEMVWCDNCGLEIKE